MHFKDNVHGLTSWAITAFDVLSRAIIQIKDWKNLLPCILFTATTILQTHFIIGDVRFFWLCFGAGTYQRAREKARCTEDTDDVATTDGEKGTGKRRRKANTYFDDHETSLEESHSCER